MTKGDAPRGATGTDGGGGGLRRRLGLTDAVVIGLGSMIGAGVFTAPAPAARAAGSGLLLGLALAAVVAYCNATSTARLAARYPASGGAYVYGRERLGPLWGYLAGWAFVIGKTASCAAMALTFGAYVAPDLARPLAIAAVIALTVLNLFGVQRSATAARVMVAFVLVILATVVGAAFLNQPPTSTGTSAQSRSAASAWCVLVVRTRTSYGVSVTSSGVVAQATCVVKDRSGVRMVSPRCSIARAWSPRATATTGTPAPSSSPAIPPPIAPAPMTTYRVALMRSTLGGWSRTPVEPGGTTASRRPTGAGQ